MKRFLLGLVFLACGLVHAQETPTVTTPRFGDDTYVQVPLQFGFPFYGRTFTNSWMHSNGVVSFLDPAVPIQGAPYNPGSWAYCCEGTVPTTSTPQFSYMITPLWTDLYPVSSSTFRTEGTTQYQKYFWNNIAEISNMSNLNSFSLEIQPSGFIGANYTQINIQNQNTWIGTIGDPTKSEWNQIYFGRGVPSTLPNWSVDQTGVDQCTLDPLSSPTCPLYTQTMCASNPLFSTQCSGYAAAYYSQQCSLNPLYDPFCPGYASAYLDYQCSLDPLYSTTCQGYEQAYFKQQCTNDPLYDPTCPGYAEAYFALQCSNDGLYATTCPNYATAYAAKQALTQSTTVVTTPTITTTTEVAAVAVVSDPVVNEVVTSSATSATSTTATVSLVSAPTEATPNATTTSVSEATTTTSTEKTTETKTEQPNTRQEVAAKRKAAAVKAAVANAKATVEEMSNATSMESQVAVQNVVIAAMGFTPGFDTYKFIMPDGVGYKPFSIYKGQTNVDNRRLGNGLYGPSDKLHAAMVDAQYKD